MNCSFCGSPIEAGTGKMYIRRDATVFHFCSSKCQRNQVELGRVNRHVRWTQAANDHKAERIHGAATRAASPSAAKAAKAARTPKAAGKAPAGEPVAKQTVKAATPATPAAPKGE